MPKFLTIQKLDNRQFSVSGFAVALRSDDFDGTNYKRWHAKMVLWLTAINCYYITQGKPEKFILLRRWKSLWLPMTSFEAL